MVVMWNDDGVQIPSSFEISLKMKKQSIVYVILYVISMSFFACEKEADPDSEADMVKISTAMTENSAFEVTLYANDTLFEGYNRLFISVTEAASQEKVTDAVIQLHPLMDMIDMKHAAPTENPVEIANEDGYFEGAVVFIMPSTQMMGWTLGVDVSIGDKEETATLVIPVVKSLEEARKFNLISPLDDTKYFVSLVEPTQPEVGMNDFELTVHYKENMMSFPATEGLNIEIEPEMPSMEHGSPNNEHPVSAGNGHYSGKINFTMTGWWRIHLVIKKDGEIITDDSYLDITLK